MEMIRAKSATRAFSQNAGTKLAVIGINAATGILTARKLAPEGRGELSAMILWYVFLASALSFGLPSSLTFRLRERPEKGSELAGAAVAIALASSGLAILAGYFGLPHWMPQYSASTLFFARLFLLNIPVSSLCLIARAAVESRGDFTSSNISVLGPPALTLVFLLLLLRLHSFTAVHAASCYALSGLPFIAILLSAYVRSFNPSLRGIFRSTHLLLSYGIRSYGIDLCGTMMLYVDQALVVRILDPAQMGSYIVALSLSRMLNAFHAAVAMILFPRAVSRTPEDVRELSGNAVRVTTLITVPVGMAIILLGPFLLTGLYGEQFRPATGILRILVVEVILAGITQVLSQAFMALGRPGVVTSLQVLGLCLAVPLMLLLVPRLGITGAAISLLLSTMARLTFVLVSFPSFLKLQIPWVVPRKTDYLFARDILLRIVRFA